MRERYIIRPTEHGQSQDFSELHSPYGSSGWEAQNFKSQQHSHKKRWGYDTAHRTLTSAGVPQSIVHFKIANGNTYTLYLTDTNLCKRETGGSNTFSYLTEEYITGTVTSISTVTVEGSGSTWNAAGDTAADAGDMFIMDTDNGGSELQEHDANWATILSVTDADTLVLTSAYTGATSSGNYSIRKVYTVPTDERWSWAIVNDVFCFSNGNTHVQKYIGSGKAVVLEADPLGGTGTTPSVATKARYLLSFADRLVIADYGSTRDPQKIAWSKNGDATDWDDTTSGDNTFIDTSDKIMGLGRVGSQIVVYMENSVHFGIQTGNPTTPIIFPTHSRGIGCKAPYSIVHACGTNVFLAEDNFYKVVGEQFEPIGDKLRLKFLEIVGDNIDKVVGFHNPREHEVIWIADTTEGRLGLSWDYYDNEWNKYIYGDTINCIGEGDEPS